MTKLAYDKDGTEYRFDEKSKSFHPNVLFNDKGTPHTFNISTEAWEPQLTGDQAMMPNEDANGNQVYANKDESLMTDSEKMLSGIRNGDNTVAASAEALSQGVRTGGADLLKGTSAAVDKTYDFLGGDGGTSIGNALNNAGEAIEVKDFENSIVPDTITNKVIGGIGQALPSIAIGGGATGLLAKAGLGMKGAMIGGTAIESALRNATDEDILTYVKHVGIDAAAAKLGIMVEPFSRLLQVAVQGGIGGAMAASEGGSGKDIIAATILGGGMASMSKKNVNGGFDYSNKAFSKIKSKFRKNKDGKNVDTNIDSTEVQGNDTANSNEGDNVGSIVSKVNASRNSTDAAKGISTEKVNGGESKLPKKPPFENLLTPEGDVPSFNSVNEAKNKLTPETVVTEHPIEKGKYAIANKDSKAIDVLAGVKKDTVSSTLKNVNREPVKKHSVDVEAAKETVVQKDKPIDSNDDLTVSKKETVDSSIVAKKEVTKTEKIEPEAQSSKKELSIVKVEGHDSSGLLLSKNGKGKSARQFQSERNALKDAGEKYDVIVSPKNSQRFVLKLKDGYTEPVKQVVSKDATPQEVKYVSSAKKGLTSSFRTEAAASKKADGIGDASVVPHPTKDGYFAVKLSNSKPKNVPTKVSIPEPVKQPVSEVKVNTEQSSDYKYKGVSADDHIAQINKDIKKIDSINRGIGEGSARKLMRDIQHRITEVAANDKKTAETLLDHTISEQSRLSKNRPMGSLSESTVRAKLSDNVIAEDSTGIGKSISSMKNGDIIARDSLSMPKSSEKANSVKSKSKKFDSKSDELPGYGKNLSTLVFFHRLLTGSDPIVAKLKKGTRGIVVKVNDKMVAAIDSGLSKDIDQAVRTLSHEIGHIVDFAAKYGETKDKTLSSLISAKEKISDIITSNDNSRSIDLSNSDLTAIRRLKKIKEARNPDKAISHELNKINVSDKLVTKLISYISDINNLSKANKKRLDSMSRSDLKYVIYNALIKAKKSEISALESSDAKGNAISKFKDEVSQNIELDSIIDGSVFKEQAISISKYWREYTGTNKEYVDYRESSNESIADTMSMLMNDPEKLKVMAPELYSMLMANAGTGTPLRKSIDIMRNNRTSEEVYADIYEGIDKTSGVLKKSKEQVNNQSTKSKIASSLTDSHYAVNEFFESFGTRGDKEDALLRSHIVDHKSAKVEIFQSSMSKAISKFLDNTGDAKEAYIDAGVYSLAKLVVGSYENTGSSKFVSKGMNFKEANEVISILEKKHKGIREFDKDYKESIGILRDDVIDSGIYTKETQAAIKSRTDYHVSLQYASHILERYNHNSKSIGGLGDLENPLDTMVKKTMASFVEGNKNRYKKESISKMVDTLKGKPKILESYLYKDNTRESKAFGTQKTSLKEGYDVVSFKKDGIEERYFVAKHIKEALEVDYHVTTFVSDILATSNNIIRDVVVTRNPVFGLKSLIMDPQTAIMNDNVSFWSVLRHLPSSAIDAKQRAWNGSSRITTEMLEKGITTNRIYKGSSSINDSPIESAFSDFQDVVDSKFTKKGLITRARKGVIRNIDNFMVFSESLTRIAAYKSIKIKSDAYINNLKKENPDMSHSELNDIVKKAEYDTIMTSKEIGPPDYNTKGTSSSSLGGISMFFNARVQGLVRLKRVIGRNPVYAIGISLAIAGLPEVLQTLASEGVFGDELKKKYSASGYDLDSNYILPISVGGYALSIPIEYSYRPLTKAIRALTRYSIGAIDGEEAAGDVFAAATSEFAFQLSPLVKVMLDDLTALSQGSNIYDFMGRPVVPNEIKAEGDTGRRYMAAYIVNKLTAGLTPLVGYESKYKNEKTAISYGKRMPFLTKIGKHESVYNIENKKTQDARKISNELKSDLIKFFKEGEGNLRDIRIKYVKDKGVSLKTFNNKFKEIKLTTQMSSSSYTIYKNLKSSVSKSKSRYSKSSKNRLNTAFEQIKSEGVDIHDNRELKAYFEENNYPYSVRRLRPPKGL